MSIPQLFEFIKMMPQIAAWLEAGAQNLTVPRPDYSPKSVALAEKYAKDPQRATKKLKKFREKTKGHKRFTQYGKKEIRLNPTWGLHNDDVYDEHVEKIEELDEAKLYCEITKEDLLEALKIAGDGSKIDCGPINLDNIAAQYYSGDIRKDGYATHGHALYNDLDKVSDSESTESKDSDLDMNTDDSEHDSLADQEY